MLTVASFKIASSLPMTSAKTGLCDPAFSAGEAISQVLSGVRRPHAILRLLRRRASQRPFIERPGSHVNAELSLHVDCSVLNRDSQRRVFQRFVSTLF